MYTKDTRLSLFSMKKLWVIVERTKRYVLSCKHVIQICSTCKRVIKILLCTHILPCASRTNVPKYILSCAYTLPLYFTCGRAMRHILHFTHALLLYNLWRMLLTSNLIWYYHQCTVCNRIWYRAIFCAILYLYATRRLTHWYFLRYEMSMGLYINLKPQYGIVLGSKVI